MARKVESIFLDTNVALDHLADRQPFSPFAHRLFALAEMGDIRLYISALTCCNLYYLLRKFRGHTEAIGLLAKLNSLVSVTTVGGKEIGSALSIGFRDFEDAVQYVSARTVPEVRILVTRNRRDFVATDLEVLSPEEYLSRREDSAEGEREKGENPGGL